MPPAPPNSDDYAIVVGVDRYSADIPQLQGSVNDANLFQQWLTHPAGGGLPVANVSLFPSPAVGALQPVKDQVEDAIGRFVVDALNGKPPKRRIYLYFSGHGMTPRGDSDECALLMANATQLFLGRCVPGRRAARSLRNPALFAEVVLLMDCCREVTGSAEAVLSFPDQADPTAAQNVRWLYGFATKWSALAAARQLPHPLDVGAPPLWHGVFTHAVLEGLSRGVNAGGMVDAASLARFVKERTQDLLPQEDNQRPDFQSDGGRPIVFGPGTWTKVKVTLANPALGFQIRDGLNIATRLVLPVSAGGGNVLFVQLPPGRYLFAAPATGDDWIRTRIVSVLGGDDHVEL
ncbi:MAG TPA: caspase family protein [Gemmataceae bacterium]|nr:caspase family protein [Gemmataceae bacterium]